MDKNPKLAFQYTKDVMASLEDAYFKYMYAYHIRIKLYKHMKVAIKDNSAFYIIHEMYLYYVFSMLRELYCFFLWSDEGPKDKSLEARLKTTDTQRQALSNFRNNVGFHISGSIQKELEYLGALGISFEGLSTNAMTEDALIIGEYIMELYEIVVPGHTSEFLKTVQGIQRAIESVSFGGPSPQI